MLFEMIYTDQVVLTAAVMGLGSIATGEFILVKHDGTDDLAADSSSDWKAKVLEVRALDEEHVYIRVSWLNRPEDLAGGRRDYHGKNELVPTNQIDIIDATTVNGKFDLKWRTEMEDIDSDDAFGKEVYYWSQTLDFTNQHLSKRPGADGARNWVLPIITEIKRQAKRVEEEGGRVVLTRLPSGSNCEGYEVANAAAQRAARQQPKAM